MVRVIKLQSGEEGLGSPQNSVFSIWGSLSPSTIVSSIPSSSSSSCSSSSFAAPLATLFDLVDLEGKRGALFLFFSGFTTTISIASATISYGDVSFDVIAKEIR